MSFDDTTDPYVGYLPEPEETTVAMSPEGITWLSTLIDKFGWDRINQAMFASPLWEKREKKP